MRDYSETFKSLSVFNSWEDKFHFLDLCENKISQFEDSLNEFQFQTAGVFYAEAFAFLVFCEMFKVDIILESGMSRGNSTELWAKNFKGNIITFENDRKPHHDEVVERLSVYDNVEINFKNSFSGFDDKISQFSDRQIGLFIDGPKDLEAVGLAKSSFKNDNVIFAGIHDVANPITKCRPNYGFMDQFSVHLLSTDEKTEFREKYSYLDDLIFDPNGAWIYNEQGVSELSLDPKAILKRFPSGPGIGIALNR